MILFALSTSLYNSIFASIHIYNVSSSLECPWLTSGLHPNSLCSLKLKIRIFWIYKQIHTTASHPKFLYSHWTSRFGCRTFIANMNLNLETKTAIKQQQNNLTLTLKSYRVTSNILALVSHPYGRWHVLHPMNTTLTMCRQHHLPEQKPTGDGLYTHFPDPPRPK